MRAATLAVFAAILVSSGASFAAAEPRTDARTAEAKSHFKEGTLLYKQGRYREAIAEFDVAYVLKPHGVVRFNMAQCYEKLGEPAQAIHFYQLYLQEVPAAKDRSEVEGTIAALVQKLVDGGFQLLVVESLPPGAGLFVDGSSVGKTPWSQALPLGPHRVQAGLPGYSDVIRDVDLTPEGIVKVTLALPVAGATPPPPPAIAAATPPPAPPAVEAAAAPPEAVAAAPAPEAVAPVKPRVWTWVAGGVAAASLVAAVSFGLAAKSASDELRGAVHDGATAQSLHDAAGSRQTTANVLYGVGAAAGVAGGVLFLAGRF